MDAARIALEIALLVMQAMVVVFLVCHDWVPMGRLNNSAAKRAEDSLPHLLWTTAIAAVPAAIGLFYCARYFGHAYPGWLWMFLWIMYGLFLLGILRAWWIPYLLVPDAKRAARYQVIFADTHRFLPERNGIAPDTLHTVFHMVTVGAIVLLLLRGWVYG
jgi:hypothetical protein